MLNACGWLETLLTIPKRIHLRPWLSKACKQTYCDNWCPHSCQCNCHKRQGTDTADIGEYCTELKYQTCRWRMGLVGYIISAPSAPSVITFNFIWVTISLSAKHVGFCFTAMTLLKFHMYEYEINFQRCSWISPSRQYTTKKFNI